MQNIVYNKIDVRSRSDGPGEGISGEGIQILIDGTVYTDGDDYYVNVDSFFEALAQDQAVIEFVGGCHYPPCCANGAWTKISMEAWIWNEDLEKVKTIRLRWSEVLEVTAWMLRLIEKKGTGVWCANMERMDYYQDQLTLLAQRVHDCPVD